MRSNRSVLNVNNGGTQSKKQPLDKNQGSKFCQSSVKQTVETHFQNLKKKKELIFFVIVSLLRNTDKLIAWQRAKGPLKNQRPWALVLTFNRIGKEVYFRRN